VIDIHSHILPGLDDGARTIQESRALARAAASEGVRTIVATPHVRSDYPTLASEMARRVQLLREDLAGEEIEVELLEGGEIDLAFAATLGPEELRRFTLGGAGRYVLVEFPYGGAWPDEGALARLEEFGLKPILAHPERNGAVQEGPEQLEALVERGCLIQVTAASLTGHFGARTRATAAELLNRGLVHVVASDTHSPALARVGLADVCAVLANDDLARYLTQEAPAAILGGARPPAPPT